MEQKRILLIDDHDSILLFLGTFLGKHYEVITKQGGLAGMAWLNSGHIPDLIILDMQMPSFNGLEFLSTLRSSGFFKDIPVLVISASEEWIGKCKKLGIESYITKPFNPIDLVEKIEQAVQTKAASA